MHYQLSLIESECEQIFLVIFQVPNPLSTHLSYR